MYVIICVYKPFIALSLIEFGDTFFVHFHSVLKWMVGTSILFGESDLNVTVEEYIPLRHSCWNQQQLSVTFNTPALQISAARQSHGAYILGLADPSSQRFSLSAPQTGLPDRPPKHHTCRMAPRLSSSIPSLCSASGVVSFVNALSWGGPRAASVRRKGRRRRGGNRQDCSADCCAEPRWASWTESTSTAELSRGEGEQYGQEPGGRS